MRQSLLVVAVAAALVLPACVTKSNYLRQVDQARTAAADRDALKARLEATQQAKTVADQDLAAARGDNEKLLQTLDASKSALNQRVADLTRENQDLAQKWREAEQARQAEVAKVKGTYEQLVSGLQDQIQAGQIQIKQLAGRLSVNMVDKILFASGQSTVKPEGQQVLKKVSDVLKTVQDKDIRIEGHTDNVPISGVLRERFPSNWELSTARATAVVRYLQDVGGVPPQRLFAAGYSDTRPVASNDMPEGRQQNRRIEIVLVPAEAVTPTAPAVKSENP